MSKSHPVVLEGQPGEAQTLTGVLERILFFSEETHYCVGELKPDEAKQSITITGSMPRVQCGETLEVQGVWEEHSKHGRQFKVQLAKATLPSSVYGIRKYLGSGLIHGVGSTYAHKIVDTFGEKTLHVISNESTRLLEIPGIGRTRAKAIKQAWEDQQSTREVYLFLQTYGVTNSQCLRLVKTYGPDAKRVIEKEPYKIARDIHGFGFRTADRIALNIGFSSHSPERLRAGLLFALETLQDEGHTCSTQETLIQLAAQLLEIDSSLLAPEMEKVLEERRIVACSHTDYVQLPVLEFSESLIADRIKEIKKAPSSLPPIQIGKAIAWAQERSGFEFAPEQVEALKAALGQKLSILTGGPGTGKTTILKALVQILRAKQVRIVLAAPTGRAAQRMAETTHHYAQTLHRLLKFDGQTLRFSMNEEDPLRCDFLIIDESSMLDTRLTAALLRAAPAQAHVLLVGDVNQLPSVGPGQILQDLMQSGHFHVTRLGQIFRQKERSSIVTTAHKILEGQPFAPICTESVSDLDPRYDLHFIKALSPEACLETLTQLCKHWIPKNLKKVHPIEDIQILAPMHRGTAGIANLNAHLSQVLNPQKEHLLFGQNRFCVGDKVIQMKNNYDKGIFNGDLGFVEKLDKKEGRLGIRFYNELLEFERTDLQDLQPAYAISIHKSQGSEFPVVVLPLLKQHFLMLQRNLLYTGITRGRKKVFIVGDPQAWILAVQNQKSTTRNTDLQRKVCL